ncbi:MAG TPA: integrin alpha, partial [Gammaproteobacteria bacterium]|nr:integrin alpha [Gammaproteobacteria bacterium]
MSQTPVIFPATLELSSLDGVLGTRFNGVAINDRTGYSVASAGDINGDGLSDLIIGANWASSGGRTYAGSSFVVFGTNKSLGATLELSTLNGANGFRINGALAGDQSGVFVASAGDINGDGLS